MSLERYFEEIESLPADLANTPSAVLYAAVITVGVAAAKGSDDLLKPAPPNAYDNRMTGTVECCIDIAAENKTFTQLLNALSLPKIENGVIIVDRDDSMAAPLVHACGNGLSLPNQGQSTSRPPSRLYVDTEREDNYMHNIVDTSRVTVEGLYMFEKYALLQKQIHFLIGNNKLPIAPKLNKIERGIIDSEIRAFTSLSVDDVYLYNQLQVLESMVNSCISPRPTFTKRNESISSDAVSSRKYYRNLPATSLPQILGNELVKEPEVVRKYYPLKDNILMTLLWPPLERRMSISKWTPVTGKRIVNSLDDDIGLSSVEDTISLSPAGNSLALLKYSRISHESWLSIYIDGGVIGFRLVKYYERDNKIDKKQSISKVRSSSMDSNDGQGRDNITDTTEGNDAGVIVSEESAEAQSSAVINDPVEPIADAAVTEDNVAEVVTTSRKTKAAVKAAKKVVRTGSFFCHTEENFRITTFPGPAASDSKPDKHGTTCLSMAMPWGLAVTACSNGVISIENQFKSKLIKLGEKNQSRKNFAVFGEEKKRYILIDGVVDRHLINGMYSRDTIFPNGSRILYKDHEMVASAKHLLGFHQHVVKEGPEQWHHMYLGTSGDVTFYDEENCIIAHRHNINSIDKSLIDAETSANVCSFLDGRVLIRYSDGMMEHLCSESSQRTHPSGEYIFIKSLGLPTIELNVALNKLCADHAKGLQIPLTKSGDCVRSMIAMPDGSALFIKYDNRVTSKVTGCIKLVKRDKSVITTNDSGVTTYLPTSAWCDESMKLFNADCKDASPPISNLSLQNSSSTATITSTQSNMHTSTNNISSSDIDPASPEIKGLDTKFVFDNINYKCYIEDHEYNCFDINMNCTNGLAVPALSLAGEVEGLKPEAISDSALEPRLFIINRQHKTTEVLSSSSYEACTRAVAISTDKDVSKECNGTSHNFYKRLRIPSKSCYDNYCFDEIFPARSWLSRPNPAAASILLSSIQDTVSSRESVDDRSKYRFVTSLTFIEKQPLNLEEYKDLSEAFESYEKFKVDREASMSRYAVFDPRMQTEIDEEAMIASKIKQSYKQAKQQAQKKQTKSEVESGNAISDSVLLKSVASDTSIDMYDDDESEGKVIGDEELEIIDTFNSFSDSSSSQSNTSNRSARMIQFEELRPALVQLLNCNVDDSDIVSSWQLINQSTSNNAKFSLNLEQFQSLFYYLKDVFPSMQAYRNLLSTSISDDTLLEGSSSISTTYSKLSQTMAPGGSFWKSGAEGQDDDASPVSRLSKTAPAGTSNAKWSDQGNEVLLDRVAVGSAGNAVKKIKNVVV